MKYRVQYTTSRYIDLSGTVHSASRIVEAGSPDEAREIVRRADDGEGCYRAKTGRRRYVASVFDAEAVEP